MAHENTKSLGLGNPTRINWFPGHMKKAMRQAEEKARSVDLILEVRDARMPQGSGNPELDLRLKGKVKLVIFNKERYAQPENFSCWQRQFIEQGVEFVVVDALDSRSVKKILKKAKELGRAKQDQFRRRGIHPPPLRMMVMGLPNTGKSTLINSFKGKKTAPIGDRPGVTQSQAWVIVDKQTELLDTPGIMPPRIDSDARGLGLCAIYAIKDEIPGKMKLAQYLAQLIIEQRPQEAFDRYEITAPLTLEHEFLEAAAVRVGALKKGGQIDWNKVYAGVINDYRKGLLGKLWFEQPAPV